MIAQWLDTFAVPFSGPFVFWAIALAVVIAVVLVRDGGSVL